MIEQVSLYIAHNILQCALYNAAFLANKKNSQLHLREKFYRVEIKLCGSRPHIKKSFITYFFAPSFSLLLLILIAANNNKSIEKSKLKMRVHWENVQLHENFSFCKKVQKNIARGRNKKTSILWWKKRETQNQSIYFFSQKFFIISHRVKIVEKKFCYHTAQLSSVQFRVYMCIGICRCWRRQCRR